MGMQFEMGMDPGQVREVAGELNRAAADVDSAVGMVDGAANQLKTNWAGPDADHFQSDWNKAKPKLQDCSKALKTMATKCTANADAQQKTSQNG